MIFGYENIELLNGDAVGVDRIAAEWARSHGITVTKFIPDWNIHGRAAGVIRNSEMIALADYVLVIWDGKSRGSRDVIEKCEKCAKYYIQIVIP